MLPGWQNHASVRPTRNAAEASASTASTDSRASRRAVTPSRRSAGTSCRYSTTSVAPAATASTPESACTVPGNAAITAPSAARPAANARSSHAVGRPMIRATPNATTNPSTARIEMSCTHLAPHDWSPWKASPPIAFSAIATPNTASSTRRPEERTAIASTHSPPIR